MHLADLFREEKSAFVKRWADLTLETYPPETVKIWRRQHDRFKNPVGHIIKTALDGLTDEIVAWTDAEAVCGHLGDILRIRSVQEFSPGTALKFIFLFKRAMREQFAEAVAEHGLGRELAEFDARVDNVVLLAFDVFTRHREQMFTMRVEEFKRAHHRLFQKAGIVCQEPAEALGLDEEGKPNLEAR
jgi:hypothetical protein